VGGAGRARPSRRSSASSVVGFASLYDVVSVTDTAAKPPWATYNAGRRICVALRPRFGDGRVDERPKGCGPDPARGTGTIRTTAPVPTPRRKASRLWAGSGSYERHDPDHGTGAGAVPTGQSAGGLWAGSGSKGGRDPEHGTGADTAPAG
jgi:hypothetical protein